MENNISVCEGCYCRLKDKCKRHKLFLDFVDDYLKLDIPQAVEPKYNGTFCQNYIKIKEPLKIKNKNGK